MAVFGYAYHVIESGVLGADVTEFHRCLAWTETLLIFMVGIELG